MVGNYGVATDTFCWRRNRKVDELETSLEVGRIAVKHLGGLRAMVTEEYQSWRLSKHGVLEVLIAGLDSTQSDSSGW
jgi:hypothetical protein